MINLFQNIDTLFTYDITPKQYPFGLDFTTLNIIILAFNLLISVYINFFGYKLRRKSDRNYQMSFDLYKNLIINNFTSFISHLWEVEKFLLETVNSNKEASEHMQLIEKTFEKIEDEQNKFYREKIPYIVAFSPEMGREIKEITETFYNNIGNLLSKMNIPLHNRNRKLLAYFGSQTDIYNNRFYELIRIYQPTT